MPINRVLILDGADYCLQPCRIVCKKFWYWYWNNIWEILQEIVEMIVLCRQLCINYRHNLYTIFQFWYWYWNIIETLCINYRQVPSCAKLWEISPLYLLIQGCRKLTILRSSSAKLWKMAGLMDLLIQGCRKLITILRRWSEWSRVLQLVCLTQPSSGLEWAWWVYWIQDIWCFGFMKNVKNTLINLNLLVIINFDGSYV